MKAKDVIKKGVELLGRVKEEFPRTKAGASSVNRQFYDELLDYFESKTKESSVGKRMLFDMGYIVWMHPEDHKKIKQQLIAIIPEVVDGFYEIINKELYRYPKCVPSSKDWFFQVTPTDVISDKDGGLDDLKKVERGKFIISSFYFSMSSLKSNAGQSNVTLSYCPINSDTMKDVNINRDLLVGIEVAGDSYCIDFDTSKVKGTVDMKSIQIERGYGVLSYSQKGVNHRFPMFSKRIYVSGVEDSRVDKNILSVPSSGVMTNHLEFRYDEEKNVFEVAAWGKTRMNEELLEMSEQGNPKWVVVPRRSSFLLGDGFEAFSLKFEQNGLNE